MFKVVVLDSVGIPVTECRILVHKYMFVMHYGFGRSRSGRKGHRKRGEY